MKHINIFKSFLIAACALFALTATASGQGIFDKVKEKANKKMNEVKQEAGKKGNEKINDATNSTNGNNSSSNNGGITVPGNSKNLNWARIDVEASWKEKGQTKYERRTYFSDIINASMKDVPDEKENAFAYFREGIVELLKARGIEIKLNFVEVHPKGERYDSREEAEENRNKMMQNDEDGGRAIYTFTWKFNAKNVSEEITQPKRVSANKPAPPMETTPVAVNTAEREAKTQNTQNLKAEAEAAQKQKLIWGFARLDVRVKNKFGKTFSRTYVSEIAAVTRGDYNAFYNTDERFIKPRIWEYFAATVAAAAKERGEEIEEPYDGSILYKFTLETTGNDVGVGEAYRFQPKSVLVEPRQREIDYAKQSSRPVFIFRWDTSGKNVQADLEKERGRGDSKDLPN